MLKLKNEVSSPSSALTDLAKLKIIGPIGESHWIEIPAELR